METSFPHATAERSSVKLPDQLDHAPAQGLQVEAAPARLWERLFALAVVGMVVFMLLRPFYIPVVNGDHYLYLAEHLVRGELSVNDIPGDYSDIVTWQGKKYLNFGPLPAVLLVPFLPLMELFNTREATW